MAGFIPPKAAILAMGSGFEFGFDSILTGLSPPFAKQR
jgi:hypothetical protein